IKINSGDLAFDTCVNPFLCSVGKNNVNISILKDTVCFTHEYIMEKQILCNDTIEAVKCNEIVKYVKSKNNFDSYNWQDSCSTGTCNDEAHTATYGYQTINYILFLGWLCD
ncbi:MAG TPA: hypothetical protein VHO70_11790, partial [Chitinispirillaceae bacterium]|nr:hypothetical protein [Chitinispirillaceae bacterium]